MPREVVGHDRFELNKQVQVHGRLLLVTVP
jgi:hypothetical protein